MQVPVMEPSEVPRKPEDVRFREVVARAHPDGERVRLRMRLTPFLQRPNLDVELRDADGEVLASSTVIENTETDLTLTLHLRAAPAERPSRGRLALSYPEQGVVDTAEFAISAPEPGGSAGV